MEINSSSSKAKNQINTVVILSNNSVRTTLLKSLFNDLSVPKVYIFNESEEYLAKDLRPNVLVVDLSYFESNDWKGREYTDHATLRIGLGVTQETVPDDETARGSINFDYASSTLNPSKLLTFLKLNAEITSQL